jgi:hypothetical protein
MDVDRYGVSQNIERGRGRFGGLGGGGRTAPFQTATDHRSDRG